MSAIGCLRVLSPGWPASRPNSSNGTSEGMSAFPDTISATRGGGVGHHLEDGPLDRRRALPVAVEGLEHEGAARRERDHPVGAGPDGLPRELLAARLVVGPQLG